MNLKEIKNSKLLCNLDKVAESYNLKGSYIELNNGISGTSLFFVIYDEKIELTPEIVKNSLNLSPSYFPVDLKAFCLDNIYETDEYRTVFDITTYLDRLSVILGIYAKIKKTSPPSTLPTIAVDILCDKFVDWRDILGSIQSVQEAERMINDVISDNKHNSNTRIKRAGMDSTKSVLYNFFKMKFSKTPNKVSLKYLYWQHQTNFKTYEFPLSYKKKIYKEMKKHPHILYFAIKMNRILKISVADDVASEFIEIMHKLLFDSFFYNKPFSLKEKFGDLYTINLPYVYSDVAIEKLTHHNIPFCYALGSNNKDFFIIPIFVPISAKDTIENILMELCAQKMSNSYYKAKQEFNMNKYNEKIKADKDNYKLYRGK